MITDISKHGARLFADGVEVPDQFHLLISGEKGSRRECQVVWRLGGEIGVTFVGPEPLREARRYGCGMHGHHLDLDAENPDATAGAPRRWCWSRRLSPPCSIRASIFSK